MDQYIGKLLDNRYEIMEQIGMGGMARVFRALDHRLNRQVAVKILREDLAEDAELRRRFHEESQAVAMLSHPNIVAVYDVSRSSDVEYIVMELIDGITLKQYMQKKGNKLNWREALHFITQIVKALGHAHSRGIIHRDIKPHNIMVLRDGSVKVADFGIARIMSAAQTTLTQEALGSVHYISPEQARGSHIDARSDLYSAGVVLYEMITGRLPFEGDTPVSVAIQHINSIPLSPREIDPAIPEALEAITMKAMASRIDQRYMNAEAMLRDLEEFRKNPVILLNHKDWELPIGRWENIRIEGTQILADALFDEKDDEAVKIADKVEGGFLRMASMGAWPPEEVSDAAELKLPGQTLPTVTRWTAREASIVTIGANHNALVLFDRQTGKPLDLTDASTVIRLMDRLNHSKIDSNMNKTLKEVLKLQDSAQDAEVIGAVNRLIENNDRLTRENQELRDAAARAESEHKEIRKSEAIRLVDAAIADGRINTAGKEAYLKLFDTDFESAKATLEAIPHRKSVTALIREGERRQSVELSDLVNKSWEELDKAGRLVELRDKAPELFREKFKAAFGTEPNM